MTTFEITVRADGGVQVAQVAGEFDLGACTRFRAAIGELAPDLLVVDLRSATFMDSHALAALIELHGRAEAQGFRLAIIRPTGYADRIFRMTGTDSSLPLYDERVPLLAQMNFG